MSEIRKNDVGTIFTITVSDDDGVVDLSSASTKQIIFTKPDGSQLTKTASFVTDGTDGKIKYTTIAGDLDTIGQWQMQGYVVLTSGQWHTSIIKFRVHDNL